ncbi:hypothetical protein B0H63DRAFT_214299 [Podospora didyma]|uniref:Uncharacterized protein n=1 Tax=Podospora didyma TaxID=330526 RepID=A0AAE0NHV1_9PEZI|nr:hypothetical protein B0H63DRAFT_214299 [Podospora didyma]
MKLEALIAAAAWVSSAAAITGPAIPGGGATRPEGKPAKMENWKWSDPFSGSRIRKLEAACEAERTFKASEYLLDDLSESPPLGLKPFFDALKKVFANREYPGSWDGIDPHGYDRNLLKMEYVDVPIKVREWIEEQERSDGPGKGLFAVYEKPVSDDDVVRNTVRIPATPIFAALRPLDKKKVVIFAPGALYETLPLWVAEGSDCADAFQDAVKYTAKPADGSVVAYPTKKTKADRKAGKRDMEFTIKAQLLKAKQEEAAAASEDSAGAAAGNKDEL